MTRKLVTVPLIIMCAAPWLVYVSMSVCVCVPQPGVTHQGFGQRFGSSVANVVSTDVYFSQSSVATQSTQQDVHPCLQLGVTH